VAWAEVNGNLVAEIPGHGLTSLASTTPYNSLADVATEPYSNNLGYYNQEFTVPAAPNTSSTAKPKIKPILVLSNLSLRDGAKALRDEPAPILAKLRSTGTDIAANVFYYDGNPDNGGELFDIQKIGRIPSGNGYIDKASFTPKTCGPHRIFARAVPLDGSISGTHADELPRNHRSTARGGDPDLLYPEDGSHCRSKATTSHSSAGSP
jgi:hypothetical protein